MFLRLLEGLEAHGVFPPLQYDREDGTVVPQAIANGCGGDRDEGSLFWTLFYLAQHYDKIGQMGKQYPLAIFSTLAILLIRCKIGQMGGRDSWALHLALA